MKKKVRKSKPKSTKRTNLKPNSKVAIFVVIVLVVLSGYYVYRSLIALTPQPIQVAEIKNATGTVNLTISSDSLALSPNQEATVTLKYDSPINKLTVISGEISYDPAVLTPSNFVKADGFPTEFVAASAVDGKIKFTYGVAVAANSGLTGQGDVMTFKVKSKAVGSSTLAITDATEVLTTGSDTNALKEITNTTISVSDPQTTSPSTTTTASTEPSTNPSTTPSNNPSTTPSTNPSTVPSISPSPSEPAISKPASPTNLKYNCYSEGKRITLRWDSVSGVSNYEITFNQKDGDDKQTKSSTRPEIDLDVKSNTTYTWQVFSVKDGVKSDPSTVLDIKCSGDLAQTQSTPTPSPTATPTPTPAPTKKPITQQIVSIFKPKSPSPTPTPSIKSSPVPLSSFVPSSPITSPGSLADIFTTPSTAPETTTKKDSTSFISKIFLGWQALFIKLVESITK